MKVKYIAGIVIIAAFAAWGASSFFATTIRYISLDQVPKSSGVVQLMGKIDLGTVRHEAEPPRLVFEVTGLEKHTRDRRLTIVYSGMVSGNFEQATSVVARGRYLDSLFVADQLLIKCPSKYQGLEGGA